MKKIPIILVSDPEIHVELPRTFNVLAQVTPLDVITRKGEITPQSEIAVIDLRGIDKTEMVQCGTLLRNAGRTVIVCDATRLPTDLIAQLHAFSTNAKRQGKKVRTELLLIEEAIEAATEVPGIKKLQ